MLLDPARLVARAADRRGAEPAPARARRASVTPRRTGRRSSWRPACTRRSPARSRELRGLRAELDARARRRSGCAAASAGHAPVHRLAGDASSRAASATRRSTARCASWPGASRRSRCTSTSACPTPRRDRAGQPACAATCRCCSRCRPTRRSGRAATRAWPRRARRSSRRSRASASRARSPTTRDYVDAVDLLVRCDAIPEPTFLWWDVRLQPRFGTVEVRIMDAQIDGRRDRRARRAGAVARARSRSSEGYVAAERAGAPEVLDENRFLAARDGVCGRADRRRARSGACPSRELLDRAARRLPAARARARLRAGAGAGSRSCARAPARAAPARHRASGAGPAARAGQGAVRAFCRVPGRGGEPSAPASAAGRGRASARISALSRPGSRSASGSASGSE